MGPAPLRVTRTISCGRRLPELMMIQMLRSPGLPCQRTSSQLGVSIPPRRISAAMATPPQARAMLIGTDWSGRCTRMTPRPMAPVSSACSILSRPGPDAPSYSSETLTNEVRAGSKMFATSSRYSTACAGAPTRSKAREPTTAVTNTRPDLVMKPPDRRRCAACHSMPPLAGTREREDGRSGGSGVDVFARGGLRGDGRVPLLPQQHLPEPDRPALESHGGARQVQLPRAVDLLADQGARLVGAGLEPLHPLAAGARVVEPQVLDVHDLPLGALHLRHRLGGPR